MSKCFKNRNLDTFCFHIPSELLREFRSLCHLNGDVQRQMVMNMMKDYIKNKNYIDTNTSKMEKTSIEYNRLLQIARKMHTWIFLHTGNEKEVYDELGLTDEENAMLGYSGQFILGDKENE